MPVEAKIISPTFTLNNGVKIPGLGLGTWQSPPGEVKQAVLWALEAGYRHLDCAFAYGNEAEVGEALKESGVKREDVFITGKLWCTQHRDAEKAIEITLKDLGTDYVDLYLMHWPVPLNPNGNHPKFPTLPNGQRDKDLDWSVAQTWEGLEKVLASGKAKAIGVSNFSIPYLEKLLETAKVVPATNQVEIHPYLPQHELLTYLRSKNIIAQAYSPLGSTASPLLTDPVITELANKYGVGAGTILLSYPLARGIVVLGKSVTKKRIEDNLKVIELEKEDVEKLDKIVETTRKRFVKPDWGSDLGFGSDW